MHVDRSDNTNKMARTRANKERRLMKKFKEMERKRLKENITKYKYDIKDGNIVKIQIGD